MNLSTIMLVIILIMFVLCFMYIEPLIMKHKVKNDNEYGSARFSTKKEIKKNFEKENINNIKEAGFPVSFDKNLKSVYFDRETPHYVYLGSTGSGKSVTAVFGEKMNLFDDINVANVTSTSDFEFNILGKEPTALYVIVPDEDKTYFTLVTIIVGLLYRELVKLANATEKKKLPYEIDFILDEFANCPPLADIEAIVSVARSRGMHFHFFI